MLCRKKEYTMTAIGPVGASDNTDTSARAKSQSQQNEHEIRVTSLFKRIVLSPLFWAISAIGVSLAGAWPVTVGAAAVVAGTVVAWRKRFVYEITLSFGFIMNRVFPTKWTVYNKITDNLFLGRLPLKNNNDHLALQKEGIGAVLSVVEKFENHTVGLFSDPVRPDDWKALGIEHFQVETPDFYPLTVESFQKAVGFIEAQHALGKKVYVHCKAGRGRSAAVVVADLMQNNPSEKFASVRDCVAFVKERRHLVSLRDDKIASIQAFL